MRGELDLEAGFGPRTVEAMPGTLVDVTPMRRTLAALRRSEELHRAVVASLEEGVLVLDHDGRCLSANAAAIRILGLDEDQVIGHRPPFDGRPDLALADGTPVDASSSPALTALREQRAIDEVLASWTRPDGQVRWTRSNLRPLAAMRGLVISMADVTEQVEAEHRLRDERDRAHHLAYHDRLTGLPNRMLLEEHLRRSRGRRSR